MRPLIVITAGAAMAAAGWWWLKNSQKPLTPVAVNGSPASNTVTAPTESERYKPTYTNLDWLDIFSAESFEDIIFQRNSPAPVVQTPYLYPEPPAEPAPRNEVGNSMLPPKGIRNNNPLNVEKSGDQWQGMTGNDGRFVIFSSPFYGIRAAARILKNYRDKYGLNTVAGIINRWAPPSDNNPTQKYADFVAAKAGLQVNQVIPTAYYSRVVSAMIHFENGYNPYDQNTITSAVAAGFN